MSRLLFSLVCLLVFSCARKPMTPSEFTREFVEVVRKTRPNLGVAIEADLQLQISNADGAKSTAFLDNAYQLYLQDPESGGDVIERHVVALVEPGSLDDAVDRTRIVPVVKDRSWPTDMGAAIQGRGGEPPKKLVFEDLNEDLVIVYAVDHPKSMSYLSPEDLIQVGVSRPELRPLAVENLKKILPKVELTEGPLFSLITAGGDYDASLLLIPEIWTGGSLHVAGDIVVAVPSRDVLLVSGSENEDGIAKLRELAADTAKSSPYRLTDTLFVYRDGGFTRFEGKSGH